MRLSTTGCVLRAQPRASVLARGAMAKPPKAVEGGKAYACLFCLCVGAVDSGTALRPSAISLRWLSAMLAKRSSSYTLRAIARQKGGACREGARAGGRAREQRQQPASQRSAPVHSPVFCAQAVHRLCTACARRSEQL